MWRGKKKVGRAKWGQIPDPPSARLSSWGKVRREKPRKACVITFWRAGVAPCALTALRFGHVGVRTRLSVKRSGSPCEEKSQCVMNRATIICVLDSSRLMVSCGTTWLQSLPMRPTNRAASRAERHPARGSVGCGASAIAKRPWPRSAAPLQRPHHRQAWLSVLKFALP